VFEQKLDQSGVVREYASRPRLDLGKHSGVVVLDVKAHPRMLAHV